MGRTLLKTFLFFVFVSGSYRLRAQDSSTQKQVWPEVEAYYRVSEKVRFYGVISGTRSNSENTDGTFGIYMDYFAIPWLRGKKYFDLHDTTMGYYWWFRTGYSYSDAPPGDKKKVVNIFETETNNNFHLPAEITLQTRNRLDWRWVNGDFQPVYRPRVKFIRNFKTEYMTFNAYIWSEYFFYLNDNSQDRLRLTFGTEIKVTRNLDLEIYYLHQFANQPGVQALDAIGIQLDLYFKSRHYRQSQEPAEKKP